MSRKITFLTLFLWLMTVTFPVIAQQKADTTYTFRFVPQKDMFYVPWNGNDTELARLLECIENNKTTILDGKLPLLVDGYCNSLGSETENLATAKIRANRVKSELITRAEIKEENFITRNHATEGDFVTVRLTVPVKETAVTDAEAEARRKAEAAADNGLTVAPGDGRGEKSRDLAVGAVRIAVRYRNRIVGDEVGAVVFVVERVEQLLQIGVRHGVRSIRSKTSVCGMP